MAHRFILPALAALASFGILAGATTASAQLPYRIESEVTNKTIASGGTAKFDVKITNESADPLKIYVLRTTNEMPDQTWISAICFGGSCYAPETDSPEPMVLQPGQQTYLELTMGGSGPMGTSGRAIVKFSTMLGANPVEKEFVTVISGSSSVERENRPLVLAPAFPNPASTFASIPLPTFAMLQNISLELIDIRGNRVADLSSSARQALESGAPSLGVDLTALQNGTYFYRFSINGKTSVGSLVVAR